MPLTISAVVFCQSMKNSSGKYWIRSRSYRIFFKGLFLPCRLSKKFFQIWCGIIRIEVPKSFSKNDDFTDRSKGVGFKVDYVGSKARGWFVGVEADYSVVTATYKNTLHKERGNKLGIEMRGGYRFLLGKSSNEMKGFYITPWIGIDKIITTSPIVFHETEYKHQSIRIFPTVHVGWRF